VKARAIQTFAEPTALRQPSFVDLLGRPMRLLVLCYEMPPIGGGTGVACSQVLRVLARRADLRIDVISSGVGGRLELIRDARTTVHLLPVGKRELCFWQPDELVRWTVRAVARARTLAQNEAFDLCHCWSGFPSGLVGWWLRDLQPYLVSLRGSDVPGYNRRLRLLDPLLMRRIARRVWQSSEGVFAVSPSLRVMAHATAPDAAIGILPNGVDADFFRPRGNRGSTTLVFAGRLIERKGVAYLLDAVRRVAMDRPDVRLVVAGDGPERDALTATCAALGIQAQVSFVGHLGRDELAALLGTAGIIVLPAIADAMPNIVLEGMAAGMAVIATETSAASIVDGNGLLVPPRDADNLAEAIRRYLDDGALLRAHQARSREMALALSWDAVAAEHLDRYRRAIRATAGRRQSDCLRRQRGLGRDQIHEAAGGHHGQG
jgi:glycosyltransferase involved in cell wall biosynthesis